MVLILTRAACAVKESAQAFFHLTRSNRRSYDIHEIAQIKPLYGVERLHKSVFKSSSVSFESYEQFMRKSKKVQKWPFFGNFGLILAMFLISQLYDFEAIAHAGAPSGV